ncbi:thermostable direct hemolysin-family toxin [Vibrio parahaemolyticus]|nr:thermostable direct hemolysin-family toxin [Vibrio parahaemolyticus]
MATFKTDDPVNVKVSDFWKNRDIKRKPSKMCMVSRYSQHLVPNGW